MEVKNNYGQQKLSIDNALCIGINVTLLKAHVISRNYVVTFELLTC